MVPNKELTDLQARIKEMADKVRANKNGKANQSTDKIKEKRIKAKQP